MNKPILYDTTTYSWTTILSGQEGKNHRVPLKVYTKMVISLKLVNQIHPNFQDINF